MPAAPDWLAFCRHRVADVTGADWSTAKHRCPCGYATDDVAAFDTHLDETEEMRPEHFEVVDGWTLEQVLGWHEPRSMAGGLDVRVDVHGDTAVGEAAADRVPGAGSGAGGTVAVRAPLRPERRSVQHPHDRAFVAYLLLEAGV